MKTRWILAPLVALLWGVSGFAQQMNSMPPIVSGSGAKLQQSASYSPMVTNAYEAPTAGNVYTPVAPLTAGPLAGNISPLGGAGQGDSGCSGGCGVAGCSDCENACGCCDRYFSIYGGWNGLLDYNGTLPQIGSQVNAAFDDGYGGGFAVGRYLTPRLRSELDFSYRHNDGDAATLTGGQTGPQPVSQPLDGDIDCYGGLFNLICDFGGRRLGRITPYAGGGGGFAFVEADFQTAGFQYAIDDSAFAYQGILGLLFPMGERADWFCEYRYFATDTLAVNNLTDNSVSEYDYRAHNFFFGMRFCR